MKGIAMSSIKEVDVDNLLQVLVRIDNTQKMKSFLEDVFTIGEIRDSSQRLKVALMLDSGKSYIEIEKETGASATTIARVSKCLNNGQDGYRVAINALKNKS